MSPPDRRPKESDALYEARCAQWLSWRAQEPLVDLWSVTDTEVAEYRRWAGMKKHHDDLVESLVRDFKEES